MCDTLDDSSEQREDERTFARCLLVGNRPGGNSYGGRRFS